MVSKTTTGHDSQRWLDRVVPLPKEVEINESVRVPAGQVALKCSLKTSPPVKTATGLLRSFALIADKDAPFMIGIGLLTDVRCEVDQDIKNRLLALPNREQAYAILMNTNVVIGMPEQCHLMLFSRA